MSDKTHEVRDPIHVFIRLDSAERRVLNSEPYQRLRDIHQLAMTYLVYPGATHRRFEHCLGVMELAGRIYDIVTDPDRLYDDTIRKLVPKRDSLDFAYWKRVIRMAALCHDLGHLPFSHAAELELLPEGITHELLSLRLIQSEYLTPIWKDLKIDADDVGKLALGPKEHPKPDSFSDWETILAEIIVGDAFGADRMDYLLRDSYHAGVSYGRFDHYRLIDTLRILPRSEDGSKEPTLGIEQGGLQTAEALLWARYFMYTQLYFHPVRRIYDIHLKDFLMDWLPNGHFSTELREHLALTDNEVLAAIRKASKTPGAPGHGPARRITCREHFRPVYERNPIDQRRNPESVELMERALKDNFGPAGIRRDRYAQKSRGMSFPVFSRDGRIQNSLALSETLQKVPVFAVDWIFVDSEIREIARQWVEENRATIIPVAESPKEISNA
jgi:HD superfamily phosphohydrolase